MEKSLYTQGRQDVSVIPINWTIRVQDYFVMIQNLQYYQCWQMIATGFQLKSTLIILLFFVWEFEEKNNINHMFVCYVRSWSRDVVSLA